MSPFGVSAGGKDRSQRISDSGAGSRPRYFAARPSMDSGVGCISLMIANVLW